MRVRSCGVREGRGCLCYCRRLTIASMNRRRRASASVGGGGTSARAVIDETRRACSRCLFNTTNSCRWTSPAQQHNPRPISSNSTQHKTPFSFGALSKICLFVPLPRAPHPPTPPTPIARMISALRAPAPALAAARRRSSGSGDCNGTLSTPPPKKAQGPLSPPVTRAAGPHADGEFRSSGMDRATRAMRPPPLSVPRDAASVSGGAFVSLAPPPPFVVRPLAHSFFLLCEQTTKTPQPLQPQPTSRAASAGARPPLPPRPLPPPPPPPPPPPTRAASWATATRTRSAARATPPRTRPSPCTATL
jgi:hypothetical protein